MNLKTTENCGFIGVTGNMAYHPHEILAWKMFGKFWKLYLCHNREHALGFGKQYTHHWFRISLRDVGMVYIEVYNKWLYELLLKD